MWVSTFYILAGKEVEEVIERDRGGHAQKEENRILIHGPTAQAARNKPHYGFRDALNYKNRLPLKSNASIRFIRLIGMVFCQACFDHKCV